MSATPSQSVLEQNQCHIRNPQIICNQKTKSVEKQKVKKGYFLAVAYRAWNARTLAEIFFLENPGKRRLKRAFDLRSPTGQDKDKKMLWFSISIFNQLLFFNF